MIVFVAVLFCAVTVSADVVCVRKKVSVANGRINLGRSVNKVSGSSCPSNSKLIADLSGLPNEAGDIPAAAAGKLFTGSFATGGTAGTGTEYSGGVITFPASLSGTLPAHVIEFGGSPTAECPGTFSVPDAAPGHLCVYVSFQDNVTVHTVYGTIDSYSGESSRLGAGVYSYATAAGPFYSWGTWAVRESSAP